MPISEHTDRELVELFHSGRKLTYQKGEIILRAGDVPQGVYFIETGCVKIYALSRQGTEHTHLFYMAGDIFPLIWAFKDAIRNVYYEALQETVVWVVTKDKFRAFVDTHAQASAALLEQTVGMFRLYAGRIDNLLYSNSHDRIAYYILSVIDRFGERRADGSWLVDMPITHHDIASSINLSRETVSRGFERLRRKEIIGPNIKGQLIIKNLSALVHVIGEDEVIGMWPQYAEYLTK